MLIQGDHLSGKPGNVRQFANCHGKGHQKCYLEAFSSAAELKASK